MSLWLPTESEELTKTDTYKRQCIALKLMESSRTIDNKVTNSLEQTKQSEKSKYSNNFGIL